MLHTLSLKKMQRSDAGLSYAIFPFAHAYLPELVDLWIDAWNQAMPAIDFEQRRSWIVERILALHAHSVEIFCAFDSSTGQMAGFLTFDRVSGLIDQLAVAPVYWGKGAAQFLLRDVKARTFKALNVDVNQGNPRAVRFYEQQGFQRVSAGVNENSGLSTWSYCWTRS